MRKYKIVIVENDEDEQVFVEQGFAESGLFDVMAILRNGDTLKRWLEETGSMPEIILSDLNMPGKNGYDIIQEVRATPSLAHIPVVITSTSSARTIMERCLNLGAAGYLVKPDTFLEYKPFAENLYQKLSEGHLVAPE
ncbi:MAG: response regulator [Sphingobacteriales bacterium]|nr:MAG: response regulator [Sphingobacteriales bacterium]